MLTLLWYNQTISVNADTPASLLYKHKGFFKYVFAVILRLLSSRPRYILLGQLKYQPPLEVTSLMLPHRAACFFTQQRWYRCSLLLDKIANRRWGRDELLRQTECESKLCRCCLKVHTLVKIGLKLHALIVVFFLFFQDLEFHGVMRFYFQDRVAGNFATKCIRVSSTATTQDVIETLAEKFRPDMRMLSSPKYSLYEVHVSGGEL